MLEVPVGERIAEKIKARAKARKEDVNQVLQKYAQERLCVRLWAHEEGSNLSLKGGAAYHFAPEFLDLNRPTADIDVHTYEVLAHDEIVSLFRKATDIEDGDGMTFEIGKTSILEHEHGEHHGIRIHIVAVLGRTRIPAYADVGIGGEPPVGMRDIRVRPMVEGQSTQTIRVQPFAYSAAEKLHQRRHAGSHEFAHERLPGSTSARAPRLRRAGKRDKAGEKTPSDEGP